MKIADPQSLSKAFRKYLLSNSLRLGFEDIPEALAVFESIVTTIETLEARNLENAQAFLGALLVALPVAAVASTHPGQQYCPACGMIAAAHAPTEYASFVALHESVAGPSSAERH